MRFLWGLRIALPVALGLTQHERAQILLAESAVGRRVVRAFAFIGFGASRVVARIVDDLHHYEKWIAGGVLVVAVLILWLRWHGSRPPRSARRKALHHRDQLPGFDGLGKMELKSRVDGFDAIFRARVGGQRDRRDRRCCPTDPVPAESA